MCHTQIIDLSARIYISSGKKLPETRNIIYIYIFYSLTLSLSLSRNTSEMRFNHKRSNIFKILAKADELVTYNIERFFCNFSQFFVTYLFITRRRQLNATLHITYDVLYRFFVKKKKIVRTIV